jgi:hypothetical protein
MTNHPAAEAVASEVRAEMARQRKTNAEMALALGVTAHTVARRLSGAVPFDAVELVQIGLWLGVDPRQFIPPPGRAAS